MRIYAILSSEIPWKIDDTGKPFRTLKPILLWRTNSCPAERDVPRQVFFFFITSLSYETLGLIDHNPTPDTRHLLFDHALRDDS